MIGTVCHFALLCLSHIFGRVIFALSHSFVLSIFLTPSHILFVLCVLRVGALGPFSFDCGLRNPGSRSEHGRGGREPTRTGLLPLVTFCSVCPGEPFGSDGVLSFTRRPIRSLPHAVETRLSTKANRIVTYPASVAVFNE